MASSNTSNASLKAKGLLNKHINHVQLVQEKLSNTQMRTNLSAAMHTLQSNRQKLIDTKFIDWQGLRSQAKQVKNNALMTLGERLEEFERNATANGIQVHWASSAEDACAIIYEIIRDNNVRKVLKGKSMVTEEIFLNDYLQKKGVVAKETDLGELILQLNHEPPMHIVTPAIHHNRYEIGEIFERKLHVQKEHEIEKLNAIAREHLRAEFSQLKLGISGVNFALAKEGALWLIENEGNGRLCTTAPDIHVAVCGIEKVVGSMDDAATLVHLLTPSASGQLIPAYNNIITGPRKKAGERGVNKDELDGPKQVHVVLLDHNRTTLLADSDFYQALRCIRCGACMNFCPVYDKIGGHSYHTTYPGPIGEVISPHFCGLDEVGDILNFCSQCRRCSEVCPERIPLAELIRTLRAFKCKQIDDKKRAEKIQGYTEAKEDKMKSMAMRVFAHAATNGTLWRFSLGKAHTFNFLLQIFGPFMPMTGAWAKHKSLPQVRDDFYRQVAALKDVDMQD